MMKTIAQVRYKTHNVSISLNRQSGRILCFKHNDSKCDYKLFDRSEESECADYILEALPSWGWGFVEDEDLPKGVGQ